MSRRLLLLTFAIVAGFCLLATLVSAAVLEDVALIPVFGAGALAGGLLGARLNRRRTVGEGAIAAVACGVITGVVNLTYDELDLFEVPFGPRSVLWVIGISATCLVAALIGGRIGERLARRPPGFFAIGVAFTAATVGMFFAAFPVLILIGEVAGVAPMVTVEIAVLLGAPGFAAVLLGVSIERDVPAAAMFVGPLATLGWTAGLLLAHDAPIQMVVGMPLGFAAWLWFFGCVGRGLLLDRVKRRLGPVEPEAPAIAEARARESSDARP